MNGESMAPNNVLKFSGRPAGHERPNVSALARQHGCSRATIRRRLATGWQPGVLAPQKIVESNQLVATPGQSAAPTGQSSLLYGTGRGLVGLTLIVAGGIIAATSMAANAWFASSLTTDPTAAKIFATLSMAAEVVAVVTPSALRFYVDRREWISTIIGIAILAISLTVVALAASGFVAVNISDSTMNRADRITPSVATAQLALDDAKAARDRECGKVGPICRQREDTVNQRQGDLDAAKAEVRSDADPQAGALHAIWPVITSDTLRTVKAGTMMAICLAAGLIIALGSGLLFPKARGIPT
jgi:hypothetical protein